MAKLDFKKEKQIELAAIWGSEVDGDARYPKRRGGTKKIRRSETIAGPNPADDDLLSDVDSNAEAVNPQNETPQKAKKAKKDPKKEYRLHCFVEPGTSKNAVRTVFDAYQPKVELRITQKGNLLNKSQYAVLTFRHKSMALHAVQKLDGTNQRDTLGVEKLKLNLMLSRRQGSIIRQKANKQQKRHREERIKGQILDDKQFIERFISQYVPQTDP
ncbi:unnamed protein product [Phytomonas sp. Hart1]|nr:unnamed protein product [Phytomonas sp. Hart1]|eukprot:CCW67659.1 unnamed protein product [Phytomonas sp. isolate Hart1]